MHGRFQSSGEPHEVLSQVEGLRKGVAPSLRGLGLFRLMVRTRLKALARDYTDSVTPPKFYWTDLAVAKAREGSAL